MVSSVPTTTPVHVSTQIATPIVKPSIYWIKIDPVGDKQVGDVFIINATTNLSAGEEVLVQTYTSHFQPGGGRHPHSEFAGGVRTVKVIQGMNGNNCSVENLNDEKL